MHATARRWSASHRLEAGFIAGGLLVRIVFWAVTDRRFEDGLTTITHARNAADGMGLTHHQFGDVTHGFTSVLSVLVPLVGEYLSFIPGVDGFLVIRLASLVAFGATILAAWVLAEHLGLGLWARVLVYGYLAFDFNQIYYGMSGMETQMAVAILLWAIVAGLRHRPVAAGVLYGFCLLARPDYVLFVGPAMLWWLLRDRRAAARVGALAGAVVAPWVAFATLYYGSPVPNTIRAKSLRHPIEWPDSLSPQALWDYAAVNVGGREPWLWRWLSPFWEHVFVSDAPVLQTIAAWFTGALVVLAAGGAIGLWRRFPELRPAIAFTVIFVVYRLVALPTYYYAWYYAPLAALVLVFAAYAVQRLRTVSLHIPVVTGLAVTGGFLIALPSLTLLERRYQHDVEEKSREPLSLYLRDHVPRGSVVTSESAGYVGYDSATNIKLWDYPGLTSEETVAIMEVLEPERNSINWLVHAALPDYAVWRPHELEGFEREFPETAALYEEVKRIRLPITDDRVAWGRVRFILLDHDFIVMKRVRGEVGGIERARQLVASE